MIVGKRRTLMEKARGRKSLRKGEVRKFNIDDAYFRIDHCQLMAAIYVT